MRPSGRQRHAIVVGYGRVGKVVCALLREHGFREEARVPDFFREGVALTFLRKDL